MGYTRPTTKPERRIESDLCKGVKALGGRAYKFLSPGRSGVPDRVVCLPGGHVVFVELKTEDGKLSEQQKKRIEELQKMGQDVCVIYGEKDLNYFLLYAKERVNNAV